MGGGGQSDECIADHVPRRRGLPDRVQALVVDGWEPAKAAGADPGGGGGGDGDPGDGGADLRSHLVLARTNKSPKVNSHESMGTQRPLWRQHGNNDFRAQKAL